MKDGVVVAAAGDANIRTPQLELRAAETMTTVEQRDHSMNVGMSLAGGKPEVGGSFSQSSVQSTQHVAAQLKVGGNLDLQHESGKVKVVLDGGVVSAASGSGVKVEVEMTHKQTIIDTDRFSVSASSSGQFSVYKGSGKEAVTDVKSSISAPGLNVVKVTETTPEDKHGYRGFGVAGNVSDFTKRAEAPTPGIPTVAFTLDAAGKHVTVDLPIPGRSVPETQPSVMPPEPPVAEEKKHEVDSSQEVKEEPLKYEPTDLMQLTESFAERAQVFDVGVAILEGELLLAAAQGVNREAPPMSAAAPVQPPEPDVFESDFDSITGISAHANPFDAEAATGIVRGASHIAAGIGLLADDVLSIVGKDLLEEDTTWMHDDKSLSRMNERLKHLQCHYMITQYYLPIIPIYLKMKFLDLNSITLLCLQACSDIQ